MILKYEDYKLNDKSVFERVTFSPPFKPSVTYENEACFIYSLSGSGMLYGGVKKQQINSRESFLMKCGSFLNHWQSSDEGCPSEIIAIHITPDILTKIYADKIPSFLASSNRYPKDVFQKISQHRIIDEFIKGLVFYFDNPVLINEELLVLKLKELILLLYNVNYQGTRELLASLFNPVELTFKSIIQAQLFEN